MSTFTIEYCVTKLLEEWGIIPDAMLGCSLGEYVALCCSGALDLESTIKLLIKRADLLENVPDGKMISVADNVNKLNPLLIKDVNIAIELGSNLTILSGTTEAIKKMSLNLNDNDIFYQYISTKKPMHSNIMQKLLEPLKEIAQQYKITQPQIQYISNITGQWIDYKELSSPYYFGKHLCSTVKFNDGLNEIVNNFNSIFEIGPGNTLNMQANQISGQISDQVKKSINTYQTIRHESDHQDDNLYLHKNISYYWQNGGCVNWESFYKGYACKKIDIPLYEYDEVSCWIKKPQLFKGDYKKFIGDQEVIGKLPLGNWFYAPFFESYPGSLEFMSPDIKSDIKSDIKPDIKSDNILVFCDSFQVGDHICKKLNLIGGKNIISVKSGQTTFIKKNKSNYCINPEDSSQYDLLFEDLVEKGINIQKIIHCWNLNKNDKKEKLFENFTKAKSKGFNSLLFIYQAFKRFNNNYSLDIDVITNNAVTIFGNEGIFPEQLISLGFVKTLPAEDPNIKSRLIDIDILSLFDGNFIKLAEHILKITLQPQLSQKKFIAVRGNFAWFENIKKINSNDFEPKKLNLSQEDICLITGGFGELGFNLAKYLAKKYKANLVIVTRNPDEAKKKQRLNELLAQNIKVSVINSDFKNFETLFNEITKVESNLGPITGIFHCAGVPGIGLIGLKNTKDADSVMLPKINALISLYSYFSKQPNTLKFFVMFSSCVTYESFIGESDYAAANSYLDAFCKSAFSMSKTKFLSIGWGAWEADVWQDRIISDESLKINFQKFRKNYGISFKDGIKCLELLLNSHLNQCLVLTQSWEKYYKKLHGNFNIKSSGEKSDEQSKSKSLQKHLRPDLMTKYMAPTNEVEKKLESIWASLLDIENIGIDDNFFELGGQSLIAMQLLSMINKEFSSNFSIKEIFDLPTISKFSTLILKNSNKITQKSSSQIPRIKRNQTIPLSFMQEQLLFLDVYQEGKSNHYNMPIAFRIKGNLKIKKLEEAFNLLIKRHESFRTIFLQDKKGTPFQKILPYGDKTKLSLDASEIKKDKINKDEINDKLSSEAQYNFNLAKELSIRIKLFQLQNNDYILSINQHHIISDAWSTGILIRELSTIYNALINNQTPQLPKLEIQFADFALWQKNHLKGKILEDQLNYWKNQLAGFESLNLPTDKKRPKIQSYKGSFIEVEINPELTKKLKSIAKDTSSSLFMVLLTGFYILLYKYSSQKDIVLGTPIATRNQKQLENIIGILISTLVLRVNVEDLTIKELISKIKNTFFDAYQNQDIPFEKLVDEFGIKKNPCMNPIFQVMFVYLNAKQWKELNIDGLDITPINQELETSMFDLTLILTEINDNLSCNFEFNTDLYNRPTIEQMLKHYIVILSVIAKSPDKKTADFNLLSQKQYQKIVYKWNQTEKPYSKNKCIHELFEEQAEKNPGNIAIIFDENKLTYKELNEKSNQLAHTIKAKYQKIWKSEVHSDMLIGIYIERSLEMIIGILGILKAGAAYVPFDSGDPEERLKFKINDCGCMMVVTSSSNMKDLLFLAKSDTIPLSTDSYWGNIEKSPKTNPKHINKSTDLAYVIYTSGSTGKPKGVMVEHYGVINLIKFYNKCFKLDGGNKGVLQFNSISFDTSIEMIFSGLLYGNTLYICNDETRKDVDLLQKYLLNNDIHTMEIPSKILEFFETDKISKFKSISNVIVGGRNLW